MMLVLVLAILSTGLSADELPSDQAPFPASSIEFRIGRDFSVDRLTGTTISWKQYDSKGNAWRLGIAPEYTKMSDPDRYGIMGSFESTSQSLTLEGQRLFFLNSRSLARPYVGLGAFAGIGRLNSQESYLGWEEQSVEESNTRDSYRAGFVCALGAEFIIANRIALGAEYAVEAQWFHSEDNEVIHVDNELSSNRQFSVTRYDFHNRMVAMTLAILF